MIISVNPGRINRYDERKENNYEDKNVNNSIDADGVNGDGFSI